MVLPDGVGTDELDALGMGLGDFGVAGRFVEDGELDGDGDPVGWEVFASTLVGGCHAELVLAWAALHPPIERVSAASANAAGRRRAMGTPRGGVGVQGWCVRLP
jgi:hypothetical protein